MFVTHLGWMHIPAKSSDIAISHLKLIRNIFLQKMCVRNSFPSIIHLGKRHTLAKPSGIAIIVLDINTFN